MAILVAYASKHGATQQIAARIAATLRAAGQPAEVKAVAAVDDLTGYDAVVLGSAVYFGSWLKEATAFVRRHQEALISRPVWLFSSGPLGTRTTDDQGQDLRVAAVPKEIPDFQTSIHHREHQVFFGALDRRAMDLGERLLMLLPAARSLFTEGDFRDWPAIDAWAEQIAHELADVREAQHATP